MRISGHRLHITRPEVSLDFYQNKIGMTLIAQFNVEGITIIKAGDIYVFFIIHGQ